MHHWKLSLIVLLDVQFSGANKQSNMLEIRLFLNVSIIFYFGFCHLFRIFSHGESAS